MGRQRWKKKLKAVGVDPDAEGAQWQPQDQGMDPNFRLIAVHPTQPLCAVAVGPHLRFLDYSNGTIKQLDATTATGEQQQPSVRSIAFSADSQYLLSGGDDKTVRVWSVKDWSCLATFKAPKKISAAAFTQDSQYALFADKFGDVLASQVAAVPAGSESPEPALLLGHLSAVITSITVSPDNKFVVSTDKDAKVRVSTLPQKPLKGSYEVQSYCMGHTQFVTSSAFVKGAGDSYLLVTGAGDGTVRLWDPLTGELLDKYIASAEPEEPAAEEGAAGDDAAAAEQQQEGAEEGSDGADDDDEDGGEQQRPAANCAAVLCVAASPDGSIVAAAVEGEEGVLLLAVDHQQRKLSLAQTLELPGVAQPCNATFDSQGRLWVVGGVPVRSSKTVHVAVVQRSSGGSSHAVCTGDVIAGASLEALEARDASEEQQLEGGDLPSYYSHLKKRTYDPEEREARKKQRNDLKEAARLAQLSKPGSS